MSGKGRFRERFDVRFKLRVLKIKEQNPKISWGELANEYNIKNESTVRGWWKQRDKLLGTNAPSEMKAIPVNKPSLQPIYDALDNFYQENIQKTGEDRLQITGELISSIAQKTKEEVMTKHAAENHLSERELKAFNEFKGGVKWAYAFAKKRRWKSVFLRSGSQLNHVVENYFGNESSTIMEYDDSSPALAHQPAIVKNDELNQAIETCAINIKEFLCTTRRDLHMNPELMYQEKQTTQYISKILKEWDISHRNGWAKNIHRNLIEGNGGYGIVADIGTRSPDDPCVLLRAGMDASSVTEQTKGIDEYKSQTPGVMHACGNDAHIAILLGVAKILKAIEHSIKGTVRLMFQPAGEGGAGGKRMVEEGVLEKSPKPQCAFGMHIWPTLPSGIIASRSGPVLAACERFEITITGVGGHGAMPHLTIDPIVTASAIVINLQTIVSRHLYPSERGICSITKIESGDAYNIVPDKAKIRGTIRALSYETLLKLKDKLCNVVTNTAVTHGCDATPPTIIYSPDYYPPALNDDQLYHSFSKHIGSLVSKEESMGILREIEPTMSAEDFSFIAQQIPSTYFFLGQGSGENPRTDYGLNHPNFALDESVMPQCVQLQVNLALRALKMLAIENEWKKI